MMVGVGAVRPDHPAPDSTKSYTSVYKMFNFRCRLLRQEFDKLRHFELIPEEAIFNLPGSDVQPSPEGG